MKFPEPAINNATTHALVCSELCFFAVPYYEG